MYYDYYAVEIGIRMKYDLDYVNGSTKIINVEKDTIATRLQFFGAIPR